MNYYYYYPNITWTKPTNLINFKFAVSHNMKFTVQIVSIIIIYSMAENINSNNSFADVICLDLILFFKCICVWVQ